MKSLFISFVLMTLSTIVFGQEIVNPYGREAFRANHSEGSRFAAEAGLFYNQNSTLTNSNSIGVKTALKLKFSPISYTFVGFQTGLTRSTDKKSAQINVPTGYLASPWKFKSSALFHQINIGLGGSMGLPDYGRRLRTGYETFVGYRIAQVTKLETWNMFPSTPELKGDRLYEAGSGLTSFVIGGAFRVNYFIKKGIDFYSTVGVEAYSNTAVLSLRERFGYSTDKKGGIGGSASISAGFIFSMGGFGNFDHPSMGKIKPVEKMTKREKELLTMFEGLDANMRFHTDKTWKVKFNDARIVELSFSIDEGKTFSKWVEITAEGIFSIDLEDNGNKVIVVGRTGDRVITPSIKLE